MSAAGRHDALFAAALDVANAVLYEGYLLYPYTASAAKNRIRWQFGVVVPEEYAAAGTGEPSELQTEVLLEGHGDLSVTVLLRFLQVESRRIEARTDDGSFTAVAELDVDGTRHLTFDEGVEREVVLDLRPPASEDVRIDVAGGVGIEELRERDGALHGRIVRERWPLSGTLSATCETVSGVPDLTNVRVRVVNRSAVVPGERSSALRTALVSTHVLLAAENGRFLSVLDPPAAAADATAQLVQRHVWPVLVGNAAADSHGAPLVLASPIILYDFPAVAERTNHDAFDATEIDELLTLSVLSLSDEERAEARATDPRARAIVDRAEAFGPPDVARLHDGTLLPGDPFAGLDVPSLDCVFVSGTKVTKGSTVRLHPNRRADVWDAFLDGKAATVRAIHQDLEGGFYVAVTVDDDPASELHDWYGRSLFFSPDEVEPIGAGAS